MLNSGVMRFPDEEDADAHQKTANFQKIGHSFGKIGDTKVRYFENPRGPLPDMWRSKILWQGHAKSMATDAPNHSNLVLSSPKILVL